MGRPISRLALRTSSGAEHVSLALAAAGRSISSAYSDTTSTSICSSSPGVRSKSPVGGAVATLTPAAPRFPSFLNARLAAVATLKPLLVVVKTTCSLCLRSPSRSISSLDASWFSAATAYPMGSRDSLLDKPFFPPGNTTSFALLIRDMAMNVTASYTYRHGFAPWPPSRASAVPPLRQ